MLTRERNNRHLAINDALKISFFYRIGWVFETIRSSYPIHIRYRNYTQRQDCRQFHSNCLCGPSVRQSTPGCPESFGHGIKQPKIDVHLNASRKIWPRDVPRWIYSIPILLSSEYRKWNHENSSNANGPERYIYMKQKEYKGKRTISVDRGFSR